MFHVEIWYIDLYYIQIKEDDKSICVNPIYNKYEPVDSVTFCDL